MGHFQKSKEKKKVIFPKNIAESENGGARLEAGASGLVNFTFSVIFRFLSNVSRQSCVFIYHQADLIFISVLQTYFQDDLRVKNQ